jgi:mono/diheme cytochrome c family protein
MKIAQVCVAVSLFASLSAAQQADGPEAHSKKEEGGRYIAERVAMCVQCHTPREPNGSLMRSRLFKGAAIPVNKPNQLSAWAEFAPRIAGLPQYSDAQMLTLLTTGIGREGKPLRSPMPAFQLTREDAEAVIVYLKSLK